MATEAASDAAPPSQAEVDEAHAAALAKVRRKHGVLKPLGQPAARQPDGGAKMRDLILEKFGCAPETDFESNPAFVRALVDWQRRTTKEGMQLADYERRPPRGAPPFGAPFVGPALPEEDQEADDAEMGRRFEAVLGEWDGASWWYTDKEIKFEEKSHRDCIRDWFEMWNAANDGQGMRPWLPNTLFTWNQMECALERCGHETLATKVRAYDIKCRKLAEKTRAPPADGKCEHCAMIQEFTSKALARSGGTTQTETAAPRSTRVVLDDGPVEQPQDDDTLCADHVKGTPILRCWACTRCNSGLTTTYDTSDDVQQHLTRLVSAAYDIAAVTSTTPAGP